MPAAAQWERYTAEVELKGLNVHPRPSLLNETGTHLYGAVEMGWVSRAAPADGRCSTGTVSTVAGQGPSWLGVRSTEQLGNGWRARVQAEQGIDLAGGTWTNDCGLAFDRGLFVALAHPNAGVVTLGRATHPGYAVALRGDPWAGSGPASPGDAAYYARPVDAAGRPLAGSRYQVRAPQSLSYASAAHRTLWIDVQISLAPTSPVAAREYGLGLHLQTAGLHAAWGYQRWDANTWAMPTTLTLERGMWTWHAGLTRGGLATGPYSHAMLGMAVRESHGAFPGLYRLGLSVHRDSGQADWWKLGLGLARPMSRHTHWELAAGVTGPAANRPTRAVVGASLRHEFSL